MHLSAIPLGEMRTCTFCGSRLRAWYLLVGDLYKPSFPTVTGRGPYPNDTMIPVPRRTIVLMEGQYPVVQVADDQSSQPGYRIMSLSHKAHKAATRSIYTNRFALLFHLPTHHHLAKDSNSRTFCCSCRFHSHTSR